MDTTRVQLDGMLAIDEMIPCHTDNTREPYHVFYEKKTNKSKLNASHVSLSMRVGKSTPPKKPKDSPLKAKEMFKSSSGRL